MTCPLLALGFERLPLCATKADIRTARFSLLAARRHQQRPLKLTNLKSGHDPRSKGSHGSVGDPFAFVHLGPSIPRGSSSRDRSASVAEGHCECEASLASSGRMKPWSSSSENNSRIGGNSLPWIVLHDLNHTSGEAMTALHVSQSRKTSLCSLWDKDAATRHCVTSVRDFSNATSDTDGGMAFGGAIDRFHDAHIAQAFLVRRARRGACQHAIRHVIHLGSKVVLGGRCRSGTWCPYLHECAPRIIADPCRERRFRG